jgi:UDPglucose--hexose-1-phosphate uridylyltransferase
MSEIRTDPLFGDVCIVARDRAARPHRIRTHDELDVSGPCPLCPGNESMCPADVARFPQAGRWQVRAFPNRYPALGLEAEPVLTDLAKARQYYGTLPGFGAHEVIVDSPNHALPFWALEAEHSVELFRLLQRRIKDLYKDQRLLYIQIVKNHRAGAGGSLEHPHFQLMGLPFIPYPAMRLITPSKCPVCGVLDHEMREEPGNKEPLSSASTVRPGPPRSSRFMTETSKFIAFADFAPAYPYQFSIYPKSHSAAFEETPPEELEELAQLCSLTLGRLGRLLGELPLNLVLFSQPNPNGFAKPAALHPWKETMHWFIRVLPRLGRKAAFDISSGISIVHVSPEDAARAFREKGV